MQQHTCLLVRLQRARHVLRSSARNTCNPCNTRNPRSAALLFLERVLEEQRLQLLLEAAHLEATAYVVIRRHTSAYVSIRQHTSAYVSIRQQPSAYVSIRRTLKRSCPNACRAASNSAAAAATSFPLRSLSCVAQRLLRQYLLVVTSKAS
jgi:hypothetical protein